MLKVRTQGVEADYLTEFRQTGFIEVHPDNETTRLLVNNFKDESSKRIQRENALITIFHFNEVVFEGTFDEIIFKLKAKDGV